MRGYAQGAVTRYILTGGGRILFAVDDADRALGTVALMPAGDGVWELTKMAVSPAARRRATACPSAPRWRRGR